jgi:hypothetical protein
MEKLPGVLLYQITKFADIEGVIILSMLSQAIQDKLEKSSSAFCLQLRKSGMSIE